MLTVARTIESQDNETSAKTSIPISIKNHIYPKLEQPTHILDLKILYLPQYLKSVHQWMNLKFSNYLKVVSRQKKIVVVIGNKLTEVKIQSNEQISIEHNFENIEPYLHCMIS